MWQPGLVADSLQTVLLLLRSDLQKLPLAVTVTVSLTAAAALRLAVLHVIAPYKSLPADRGMKPQTATPEGSRELPVSPQTLNTMICIIRYHLGSTSFIT